MKHLLEMLDNPNRKIPMKTKTKNFLYKFLVYPFIDTYYKYVRNWNGNCIRARGSESRHGYSDAPALIPGVLFTIFMQYYENDWPKENKWQDSDYKENYFRSRKDFDKVLRFQNEVEKTAKWITEVWDKEEPIETKAYMKYYKETNKAVCFIAKHYDWFWV